MSDDLRPFTIDVPEADLEDLRQRLRRTRWPDPETCDSWGQGTPLAYARELASYWAEVYDWRRCEALLNRWPQLITNVNGLDVHVLHRRSPNPDALPLVITHGWPGSLIEFHKVIDPLADPAAHGGDPADAFHVVVPSLPGYGFSGKPARSGTGVEAIGRCWGGLMARLGYDRYVAQGGDWGSAVTLSMARTETDHCAGVHVNMPIVAPDRETLDAPTALEQRAFAAMEFYNRWDSGYSKQQSTRPQTLGYALADSPVGQLAWIVEKFQAWTDCERDGVRHPEHALDRDELLDNITLYWLSNSAASSARLYWESFNDPDLSPIDLPVACSLFPKEIFLCSRRWAERRFRNLVYWNEPPRGGHFAAFEQPALFVEELRKAFRPLR